MRYRGYFQGHDEFFAPVNRTNAETPAAFLLYRYSNIWYKIPGQKKEPGLVNRARPVHGESNPWKKRKVQNCLQAPEVHPFLLGGENGNQALRFGRWNPRFRLRMPSGSFHHSYPEKIQNIFRQMDVTVQEKHKAAPSHIALHRNGAVALIS